MSKVDLKGLKTASVLAFERNFDVSDGIFFQQKGLDETTRIPVEVTEKSVRGTISNRLKAAILRDPAKLDAEVEKANLQRVDVAMLRHDYDHLVVEWSCKVIPFTGIPSVCNDQRYQARLLEVVDDYLEREGLRALAYRYAQNIVNARWLWRNRVGASDITVEIIHGEGDAEKVLTFKDAKQYSLNHFYEESDTDNPELSALADIIEAGLDREREFEIFTVRLTANVGAGQEVYPSQELILDTGSEKSKVLYSVNGHAALHSQKIGNALRTIDTWYAEDAGFPIAIEPYGAVTTMGTAFRQPKEKRDFYSLFDQWILKDEAPELIDQHYVIAILLRGGVFGESGK